MNEAEFLKEHPSLKGKRILYTQRFGDGEMNDIHETQLDKQKVEESIFKLKRWVLLNAAGYYGLRLSILSEINKAEKELGLDEVRVK
jgi:hypothetical protein